MSAASDNMMSIQLDMDPNLNPAYAIINPTTEAPLSETGHDAMYDSIEHFITQYVFGVIFIGGVVGNIICFVVLQHEEFRQASMRFTLSALALVDTGLLVFGLLRQWLWEVLGRDPRGDNVFLCKTLYFGVYFFGQLSPWTIVLLTLERLVSIFRPLKAKTMCNTRRVVTSWILTAAILTVINLHTFLKADLITKEKTNGSENITVTKCRHLPEWEYFHLEIWMWLDFILVTILPFLVITACNCAIIIRLRQMTSQRTSHLRASPDKTDCGQQSITTMLIMVSLVFLVTTTPLGIFFVTADLKDTSRTDLIMALCNMLYYLNSSTNFILYCVSGSIFRRAFIATFARGQFGGEDSSIYRLKNNYVNRPVLKSHKSLPDLCDKNNIELRTLVKNNSYASLPLHKHDSYSTMSLPRNGNHGNHVCDV